jgi:hypothetical protein
LTSGRDGEGFADLLADWRDLAVTPGERVALSEATVERLRRT